MKNFLEDTSGNIAITVALLGVPLMIAAGTAIDYSQLARKQTKLQSVTDAAALSVALDLQTKTQAQVEKKVDEFLKSNLSGVQYSEIDGYVVTIPASKEQVTVKVTSKHPTSLMRLAGIKELNYNPESVVKVPTANAEIMMVLDSTSSMSLDGKMDDLKTSAHQFIDDLLDANGTSEKVRIGITPFARYVNVGLDNRDASWIDVPEDYSETQTVTVRDVVSKSGCQDVEQTDVEGVTQTVNQCDNVEYGPEYEREDTIDHTWSGCVGSRNFPNNLNDDKYANKKVPGLLSTYCPPRITEMTSDKTVLKDSIDALNPSGITYIPTGLIWGWRALSEKEPFANAKLSGNTNPKGFQKVLILMSDGENQASLGTTNKAIHNGNDTVQANNYTLEACDNIKKEGIKLFTIGFGKNIPVATLDILKNCSTDGKNYYNAKDGAALTTAFSDIKNNIASLYLAK
jgi:Flp pilus assembly protein TadG